MRRFCFASAVSVSYTHLDVYKRQTVGYMLIPMVIGIAAGVVMAMHAGARP